MCASGNGDVRCCGDRMGHITYIRAYFHPTSRPVHPHTRMHVWAHFNPWSLAAAHGPLFLYCFDLLQLGLSAVRLRLAVSMCVHGACEDAVYICSISSIQWYLSLVLVLKSSSTMMSELRYSNDFNTDGYNPTDDEPVSCYRPVILYPCRAILRSMKSSTFHVHGSFAAGCSFSCCHRLTKHHVATLLAGHAAVHS